MLLDQLHRQHAARHVGDRGDLARGDDEIVQRRRLAQQHLVPRLFGRVQRARRIARIVHSPEISVALQLPQTPDRQLYGKREAGAARGFEDALAGLDVEVRPLVCRVTVCGTMRALSPMRPPRT